MNLDVLSFAIGLIFGVVFTCILIVQYAMVQARNEFFKKYYEILEQDYEREKDESTD
jgi:hypothetical protein